MTIIPVDKRWAVFCDVDGTIADNDHRRHHVEAPEPDWEAYNEAMGQDTPKNDIICVFHMLSRYTSINLAAVLVSGRGEEYRAVTESWLLHHFVQYDALYMRPAGDHRPDVEVKRDLLVRARADGYEPWAVLDDRDSVVAMWREEGLTCLQVARGDF